MSVFIDRKYLLLVSSRLELFKQKNDDLFNFRCPYCGDSKKNKLKARGYIYRKNNDYFFVCHNCHVSTTFSKFLHFVESSQHRQYILERYTNGDNNKSNYKKPSFELTGPKPSEILLKKKLSIQSIKKLPEDHPARKYIEKRKIPLSFYDEIYYTSNFKDFLDKDFPNHNKEDVPNDERVVLVFKNEKGDITNLSGRALGSSKIRYCTVKVSDEKKLYGMHRLSRKDRVYVVEGQFDSFFLPNCVASGDSNLGSVPEYLGDCECVLVFDNEPRNKDIVKQVERAINSGYSVVIWPNDISQKDINDMVLGGLDVRSIIENNTYSGPTAKLKFIEWRKC